MVLPAVVETALSRYKRPVLTIKLREHKKRHIELTLNSTCQQW